MRFFFFLLLIPCLLKAQIRVDQRIYQSPVKNQVNRGTCTAFAVLAAMETLPGFPNDLSEQYVYGQVKMKHYQDKEKYSEGAQLKFYIDVLTWDGTLREDQEPYNPDAVIWDEKADNFEKMKKDLGGTRMLDLLRFPDFAYKLSPNMYQYREDSAARSVEWIKQQLDKGVPGIAVSYSVNGRYWSQHKGNRSEKMTPDDFMAVVKDGQVLEYKEAVKKIPGLPEKLLRSELRYRVDTTLFPNDGHAVCIVGYDEDGFLIKNSWGTDWGDKGYGWISFDYHRLFCSEAMYLIAGKVKGDEFKVPVTVNKEDFWLKSLPHSYEGNKAMNLPAQNGIALSLTFHGTGRMPRLKQIEYRIYTNEGKLTETDYGRTNGIFDGREDGYETYALMSKSFLSLYGYRVVAIITTVDGQKFTSTFQNIQRKNIEYKPG
jgi:hypothetical protein